MSKRYKVSVPTADCVGVDVQGPYGEVTHYNADRAGIIETNDSYHAGLIRKTLGVGGRMVGMPVTAPSVYCDVCGQEIYVAFGPTCWRCRGDFRKRSESSIHHGSNREELQADQGLVDVDHAAVEGVRADQDGEGVGGVAALHPGGTD